MKSEESFQKPPDLTIAERRQVEHADGWMMLGNPVEAERELDQIDPARQGHAEVFSRRWLIYDAAGWSKKKYALLPYRKSLRKALWRVFTSFCGLCAALLREGCKAIFMRRP